MGKRTGLGNKAERDIMGSILISDNIFRVHHLNSLFMLNRLSNSSGNKAISEFARKILVHYLNRSEDKLEKYFKIYEHTRKLSYLAPNSLLATATRSREIEDVFHNNTDIVRLYDNSTKVVELNKISNVRWLLEPTHKRSNSLSKVFNEHTAFEIPEINWDIPFYCP